MIVSLLQNVLKRNSIFVPAKYFDIIKNIPVIINNDYDIYKIYKGHKNAILKAIDVSFIGTIGHDFANHLYQKYKLIDNDYFNELIRSRIVVDSKNKRLYVVSDSLEKLYVFEL